MTVAACSRIRYAAATDVEAIVELARREHAGSRWRARAAFDAGACAATVREFIGSIGRTMFVSEGGYLAGLIQPLGFAAVDKVAFEYAWYAEDGRGLELLRRFESWARNMGATAVVCHSYSGDRLAHALARRRGYSSLGHALILDL